MILYTIYECPSDYPDNYVVKQWKVKDGKPVAGEAQLADNLFNAKRLIPEGLCKAPLLGPGEDPCIVESWF